MLRYICSSCHTCHAQGNPEAGSLTDDAQDRASDGVRLVTRKADSEMGLDSDGGAPGAESGLDSDEAST